ncbi:hypothetical protein CCUS01_09742 [Colletotrichum cuscutae]|uniref:Uncharacterized protein n=1 Tax=Colletotrichum cuscutae TaxID=1209917 RepID=A0AAI9UKI5_9PEZI|nr:hypothetical protein CCUS01_09742 [Colletotrichum cuscutae]
MSDLAGAKWERRNQQAPGMDEDGGAGRILTAFMSACDVLPRGALYWSGDNDVVRWETQAGETRTSLVSSGTAAAWAGGYVTAKRCIDWSTLVERRSACPLIAGALLKEDPRRTTNLMAGLCRLTRRSQLNFSFAGLEDCCPKGLYLAGEEAQTPTADTMRGRALLEVAFGSTDYLPQTFIVVKIVGQYRVGDLWSLNDSRTRQMVSSHGDIEARESLWIQEDIAGVGQDLGGSASSWSFGWLRRDDVLDNLNDSNSTVPNPRANSGGRTIAAISQSKRANDCRVEEGGKMAISSIDELSGGASDKMRWMTLVVFVANFLFWCNGDNDYRYISKAVVRRSGGWGVYDVFLERRAKILGLPIEMRMTWPKSQPLSMRLCFVGSMLLFQARRGFLIGPDPAIEAFSNLRLGWLMLDAKEDTLVWKIEYSVRGRKCVA